MNAPERSTAPRSRFVEPPAFWGGARILQGLLLISGLGVVLAAANRITIVFAPPILPEGAVLIIRTYPEIQAIAFVIPALFHVVGLGFAALALGSVARGDVFGRLAAHRLLLGGRLLLTGVACAAIIALPAAYLGRRLTYQAAVAGEQVAVLESGPFFGLLGDIVESLAPMTVVMALIGVGIHVFGSVLSRGASMRAELEEIL